MFQLTKLLKLVITISILKSLNRRTDTFLPSHHHDPAGHWILTGCGKLQYKSANHVPASHMQARERQAEAQPEYKAVQGGTFNTQTLHWAGAPPGSQLPWNAETTRPARKYDRRE